MFLLVLLLPAVPIVHGSVLNARLWVMCWRVGSVIVSGLNAIMRSVSGRVVCSFFWWVALPIGVTVGFVARLKFVGSGSSDGDGDGGKLVVAYVVGFPCLRGLPVAMCGPW